MDLETLPLEEDSQNSNNGNNIYTVSKQDTKKSSSDNVEAIRNEDYSKYSNIDNIVPVRTEEEVKETRSEFNIYKPKSPSKDLFYT